MLDKILRWYQASMIGDIRSPLVHLFGPPGCGKSSSVAQAAQLLGVNLHTINVSRLSPLELEGVQMPVDDNSRLHMLTATWWTRLKEGDIVLLDEFLRGFPEVYNGLLDILTARQVGDFVLPKVFFIAASNTTASYDKALEDRLLHVPASDPRKHVATRVDLQRRLTEEAGLHPAMCTSDEMKELIEEEVLPMFAVLDTLKGAKVSTSSAQTKGSSIRKLAGQIQLRHIRSGNMKDLIAFNNKTALKTGELQYLIVLPELAKGFEENVTQSLSLLNNPHLTASGRNNILTNQAMIELHQAFTEDVEDDSNTNHPLFT